MKKAHEEKDAKRLQMHEYTLRRGHGNHKHLLDSLHDSIEIPARVLPSLVPWRSLALEWDHSIFQSVI